MTTALQGQPLDSLYNLLQNINGRERFDVLLHIVEEKAPYSGEAEALEALKIARNLKYPIGEARANLILGKIYIENVNEKKALKNLRQAEQLFRKLGEEQALLQTIFVINVHSYRFFHYKEVLDKEQELRALAEKLKDSITLGKIFLNIGLVHFKLGQKEQAKDYFSNAYSTFEQIGNFEGMVDASIQLSKIPLEHNAEKRYYLDQADSLLPFIQNFSVRQELSKNVYSYQTVFHTIKGEYLESEITAKKNLQIAKLTQDEEEIALMQYYLSRVQQNEYKDLLAAITLADSSLQYEIKISRWDYIIFYAKYLSDLNVEVNQHERALEYAELAMLYQDSMYVAHRRNDKEEIQKAYEMELKENEIKLLEQQRRNRVLIVSTVSTLLLSLIGFLYLHQRSRWKVQEQQIKHLKIKEKLATELQELDEMKSRFFANVAHELRTPITLLLSPLKQLIKERENEKEFSQKLKMMHRNGEKLHELVEEILDLTKMDARLLEVQEVPVSLYNMVRRTFSTFESFAHYHGIILQMDYQANAQLRIQTDAKKLGKIINNLLSNALKYTPDKGKIKLAVKDLGSHLQIVVSDTGRGIHEDDLPRIFERFYQAAKSGANTEGGTGIGLALCDEYARLLDGKMKVESTLGEGSTFTFTFRKKEIFATEKQLEKVPLFYENTTKIPVNETAKHTILVVEDNVDMQTYLAEILSPHYRIVPAYNGLEALKILKKEVSKRKFHCILSDVMMPQMDGIEFLQNLKANEAWHQIPVIMLTARTQSKDRMKALRMGVDDYISKPFEADELLARIHNLLTNYDERIAFQKENSPVISNVEYGKNVTTVSNQNNQEWLAKTEKIAIETIGKPTFNINFIAQEMNLSERQFYRKIKELTGLTPNQYLREIRLQHARQLIEEKRYNSLEKISQAVGFSTPVYFAKLYQERFGTNLLRAI